MGPASPVSFLSALALIAGPTLFHHGSVQGNQHLHLLQRRQAVNRSDVDCSDFELSRGTWAELGIDNYLSNYPNGQNLTLKQYTQSVNVLNFDCGIGQFCLAGQLCHPVRGRDWVVLSAVQEWNFYVNSLYNSVSAALGTVQGVSAAMVADFLPEGNSFATLKLLVVGLTALSGVVILSFASVLVIPILWAVLGAAWSFVVWGATTVAAGISTAWIYLTTMGTLGAETATVATAETAEAGAISAEGAAAAGESAAAKSALEGEEATIAGGTPRRLMKRGVLGKRKHTPSAATDKFQVWSQIDSTLTALQERMRSLIALTAKVATLSPISSQTGMYGVLQNGTFLSQHPPRSTLQNNAEETAQLGALALLFRVMSVIFVIDSEPCKQEGPTTPLKNPTLVHYCSTDGVKASLGMIKEKEIDYNIRNGRLIFSKYSYSAEFLFNLATDCQAQRSQNSLNSTSLNYQGGLLSLANNGSTILQNMMISNASSVLNSTLASGGSMEDTDSMQVLKKLNNATNSGSRSTVLLPDGSAFCSFAIPICDLRLPAIKKQIAAGKTEAQVCRDALGMPPCIY